MKTLKDLLFSKFMIFTLTLLLLLYNCYLNFNPMIANLVNYSCYLLFFIIILLYLLNGKYSKFIIVFLLYCLFGIISSYIGDYSDISTFFKIYNNIITLTLYLDLSIKIDCKKTLLVLEKVFFVLVAINFFTILKYPGGLYSDINYSTNWFFKYDNLHIFMYFPALVISILCSKYKYSKKNIVLILMFIMITYSVYYCFSATSVVGYTLFLIYLLLFKFINKMEFCNSRNYFILSNITFLGIVLLRIQNIFSWFIVYILKKDLTFTNRTFIWDVVIQYIKEKPLLGYGLENTGVFTSKLGNSYYTHAHNTYLDVIYKGGLISLFIFVILLYIPIKKLYTNRKNIVSKIISFAIFCLLIMMVFESRQEKIGLYIILIFGCNVEYIISSLNNKSF